MRLLKLAIIFLTFVPPAIIVLPFNAYVQPDSLGALVPTPVLLFLAVVSVTTIVVDV